MLFIAGNLNMHPEVSEIKRFYETTSLGKFAATQLASRVREIWTDVKGLSVVGFGFAPPVVTDFLGESSRLVCLMPERQGVWAWPDTAPNVSVLTEESEWPLATGIVDRVVMLHALETSFHVAAVLDECWRVLAPEGRALIIVPHRAGLWARRELTPFGSGRPFSASQLTQILGSRRFGVISSEAALFAPPSESKFWIRYAPHWEKIGNRFHFRFAGGVLIVEAHKRVFQAHNTPLAETVAIGIKALEGIATPGAKPASNRDTE